MSGNKSSSEFKDRVNQIIRNRPDSFTMPVKKAPGAIPKTSVQVEQDQKVFQTPVRIVEREQSIAERLFPDRLENNNRSLPSRATNMAPQPQKPSTQTVVMDSNTFRLSDLLFMVPFNGTTKGCEMTIIKSERIPKLIDRFLFGKSFLCHKYKNNSVYSYFSFDQARANNLESVVDMHCFCNQLGTYCWRNNNRPPVIHFQIRNALRYLVSDHSEG